MKAKKISKKLKLSKKTIANLAVHEMKSVNGGIWESMRITYCCGTGSNPCC